jgi:hypothetical protein
MSQSSEPETPLGRSLDAIDAMRRRMFLAGSLTIAGTIAAFCWLGAVARTSTDVKHVVVLAVLALTCVIAWSTFALAIVIVRMTKRILRAIELTAALRQ